MPKQKKNASKRPKKSKDVPMLSKKTMRKFRRIARLYNRKKPHPINIDFMLWSQKYIDISFYQYFKDGKVYKNKVR